MRRCWWIGAALAVLLVAGLSGAAPGAAPQQITVTMREFSYSPARITLEAGRSVVITLVNKGKLPHEFMVYDPPKSMSAMMGHEWVEKTNYFHGAKVIASGGKVGRHKGDFLEVKVPAGKAATVAFTPTKKGTFEFGCMIEEHYENGQRGVLVVK